MPIRPTKPSKRVADTKVDAKVTIAPSALSITGAWPEGGTAARTELRRYLVEQLNYMIAVSDHATVALPTEVVLEHTTWAGPNREHLRVRLYTRMPAGDPVETSVGVRWAPTAGPTELAWPLGALACCGPIPGLGGLPCGAAAGPGGFAAALVIGVVAVVVVAVVAAVVVALVGIRANPFDFARANAFSDGLQRALQEHAQAIREGLFAREEPVPVVLPGDEEDEDADEDGGKSEPEPSDDVIVPDHQPHDPADPSDAASP